MLAIWDSSSGTRHLGLVIWDSSSGTRHLGLLIWGSSSGTPHLGLHRPSPLRKPTFCAHRCWQPPSGGIICGDRIVGTVSVCQMLWGGARAYLAPEQQRGNPSATRLGRTHVIIKRSPRVMTRVPQSLLARQTRPAIAAGEFADARQA